MKLHSTRTMRAAVVATTSATVALALGLSGCSAGSNESADGQLLRLAVIDSGTFTQNFNPFTPGSLSVGTGPKVPGIYEPMVIVNYAQGEVVPWLAEEYDWSDDGLELTFHLNEGVKWSDGEALTADDVVFTFNEAREILGEGSYSYLSDIEATDDSTVVFSFAQPYTIGLYEIGQQVIVPEHVWKDVDDPATFTNPDPVGSGPFTELTNFSAQSFDLLRNPNYWQEDAADYAGIRAIAFGGNDAATAAAISGDIDWGLGFVQDIQKVYVDPDPENRGFWFPGTGSTIGLGLNTTVAPFDDVELRKAISMAIDRDAIAEQAMSGYTHPADCTGLSDAYDDWRDPEVLEGCDWTTYDPDAANAMLDEAGYPRGSDGIRVDAETGEPVTFTIGVGSASSDWVAVSQIISDNLKEVGIDAPLNVKDWSQITEALFSGNYTGNIEWSGAGVTPFEYYRSQMSCETVVPVGEVASQNFHRYCSPEADALLDSFAAATDENEQRDLMNQLQAVYSEQAPVIPLFPGPEWGAYNSTTFVGWPSEEDPYSTLAVFQSGALRLLTTIHPR